jgi:AcrR family transcriptional regulator
VSGQEPEARRPGRPRSARAHASILQAALELLVRDGYRGFSMEAVAARAGVGKATIYRRWSSKDELLKEAIASLSAEFEYIDTGSLRGDARALVELGTPGAIQVLPQLLGELMNQPELHELFRANLMEPRRAVGREMLKAAQKRGELARDVDLELVLDMLIGPLVYRVLLTRLVDPGETVAASERVLETLLRGVAPRARRRAPSR